jgi:hypothetical protein
MIIGGLEDAKYKREKLELEARRAGGGIRFRSPRMRRQLSKLDCRISVVKVFYYWERGGDAIRIKGGMKCIN